MDYRHIPVMISEVMNFLEPKAGGRYIDCTLGGAGYSFKLARSAGKKGVVVALDQDELAIGNAQRLADREGIDNLVLVNNNFKNLIESVQDLMATGKLKPGQFDGIVFDLGLSSAQLDDESRGFSFRGNRPLDMSFGQAVGRRTSDIINFYQHGELARMFRELGEEKWAGKVASAVLEARKIKKIKTTAELVAVIESVLPVKQGTRIHPATKIFQALRMETNGELEALATALPQALSLLSVSGRLVVVSFHSGEDRIVKRFFKSEPSLDVLTKRPLAPTDEEVRENPRSRSAKLRAAIKINNFQT